MQQRVAQYVMLLDTDQKPVDATIMAAIHSPLPPPHNAFFIDSPGGCGKTFTFNLLLATVRAEGQVALIVATSSIAALLLDGGTTAHSSVKIPITIEGHSVCPLGMQTDAAQPIRAAQLIVWDEAPMAHKHCFSAVDRLLKDPTKNHLPCGGKVIVMGGDFRQMLPVIPKGGRAAIVNAANKRSAV